MPLIKNGKEAENVWTFIEDDITDLESDHINEPLEQFLARAKSWELKNAAIGVRLRPEDDPHLLEDHLDRISLIEISFPKYTDGRGYSQAQLLRRRLGYTGELRAVGHVLRDQILYMNRSGFDAFETERAELPVVVEALNEFSAFYQPAADGSVSVFHRRHRKD
ncbi:MAG: DUF934 domain-containing protein [Henriciella sp.]